MFLDLLFQVLKTLLLLLFSRRRGTAVAVHGLVARPVEVSANVERVLARCILFLFDATLAATLAYPPRAEFSSSIFERELNTV